MIAEAFNVITYSLLLISSTHKKNFSAIGRSIKKMFSKQIEGTGKWFDTKIRRKIMSFKMYTTLFTDGKMTLPFHAIFANPDELLPKITESKYDWIRRIIQAAQGLFPDKKITLLGDG
jgi:hypothetical protein